MPMIDITAPAGLLPPTGRAALRAEPVSALLAAEGVPAASPYLENTGRTWVLLTEAAEGGGGVAGFALGREEFAALGAG